MRTIVYVDGFNFFYALQDVRRLTGQCYYWIDVFAFAQALITKAPIGDTSDVLEAMHYFTAVPAKDPAQKIQHLNFFEMTRAINPVTVHDGVHMAKKFRCKAESGCAGTWKDFQEKESDVRLGITMVADAYEDKFERVVLISSDGDFVPALELIYRRFTSKEIVVVSPLGRPPNKKLIRYAHKKYALIDTDLEPHILPQVVLGKNEKEYHRPPSWIHRLPVSGEL